MWQGTNGNRSWEGLRNPGVRRADKRGNTGSSVWRGTDPKLSWAFQRPKPNPRGSVFVRYPWLRGYREGRPSWGPETREAFSWGAGTQRTPWTLGSDVPKRRPCCPYSAGPGRCFLCPLRAGPGPRAARSRDHSAGRGGPSPPSSLIPLQPL